MSYIDGFVIPVPKQGGQRFIDHAATIDAMFIEQGAIRVVECWADDVPEGKVTDFRKAVQAGPEEVAAFSWIEWPDKATRDVAMAKMSDPNNSDPRMDPANNPVPFDGKRMIFGGFESMVDETAGGDAGYVDGFVAPVTPANRAAYLAMAQKSAAKFLACGALRSSENWGEDVPDGKVTDFRRAVQAGNDENVVFSWLEWPDKATRDAGWEKVMSDPDMQPGEMPFDGKRMFWGGFVPVVDIS
jgi:uncharacterized protein YbaA (DUF1428 family)